MSTAQTDFLTPAEYLELERKSEIKHEYFNGRMYAMAGASRVHSVICVNLARELSARTLGGPCQIYDSNIRVKVSPTGLYTYPDLSAACGDARFEDAEVDTLLNPVVLIEVLSDTTERYDRGDKFQLYRQIQSLQEYVLVSQKKMLVEHFLCEGESWRLTTIGDANASVRFPAIGCDIPLAGIYANVRFSDTAPRC